MPLQSGKDDATIQQNIKKLIAEGYSPEQAAAIAHDKAGRMMQPKMNEDEMMMTPAEMKKKEQMMENGRRQPRNLSRWFDS